MHPIKLIQLTLFLLLTTFAVGLAFSAHLRDFGPDGRLVSAP